MHLAVLNAGFQIYKNQSFFRMVQQAAHSISTFQHWTSLLGQAFENPNLNAS